MRNWEERYEKLTQGNTINNRLADLEKKIEDKIVTKDEYGEYKKLKAVKDNLPKVSNILQYREVLTEKLKKVTEEIEVIKRENIYQNEEQKLEKELNTLIDAREKLGEQIKQTEKGSEKKAEINYKLRAISEMVKENNARFAKIQSSKAKYEEKRKTLSGKTESELLANKMNINSKISKCNMICSNLLKGYSWNSIDIKLEKWQDRKLTSNKEVANRMRQAVKENNKEKVETNLIPTQVASKLPENVSEFDKKHPRIAAIKNMFKRAGKWVKNVVTTKIIKKSDKSELKTEKTEKAPKENNEKHNVNEKDDFRDYIKVVAEKGYEQANKEKLQKMQDKSNSRNDREDETR